MYESSCHPSWQHCARCCTIVQGITWLCFPLVFDLTVDHHYAFLSSMLGEWSPRRVRLLYSVCCIIYYSLTPTQTLENRFITSARSHTLTNTPTPLTLASLFPSQLSHRSTPVWKTVRGGLLLLQRFTRFLGSKSHSGLKVAHTRETPPFLRTLVCQLLYIKVARKGLSAETESPACEQIIIIIIYNRSHDSKLLLL